MPIPGWLEILAVLLIVLLLFGAGRISKVAKELGNGIREFRKGVNYDKGGKKN